MKAKPWTCDAEQAILAHHRRRDFIEHLKSVCAADSDFDAAAIIFGELVGNVVRHANGRIIVSLAWTDSEAVLTVRDFGAGFTERAELPESSNESGRGLFIVRALANSVNIACDSGGCTICAVLPISVAGALPA